MITQGEWLPLKVVADQLGYSLEGLRRRLRQLRQQGYVVDIHGDVITPQMPLQKTDRKIVIWWFSSRFALLRGSYPTSLLNPKRGKRAKSINL